MKQLENKTAKVFLDSSVLMSACISQSGGSFRLCKEGNEQTLNLHINRYVYEEVTEVLNRKYPAKLSQLPNLAKWAGINILKNTSAKLVRQLFNIIDPEDAPVLAGAIEIKAQFLLTLDRKDFITKTLESARLPLIITTPQGFFQEYF